MTPVSDLLRHLRPTCVRGTLWPPACTYICTVQCCAVCQPVADQSGRQHQTLACSPFPRPPSDETTCLLMT